jgi:hypothetical protein
VANVREPLVVWLVVLATGCGGEFTCADDKTCVAHAVPGGSSGSGAIRLDSSASLLVRNSELTAGQYGVVVTVYPPVSGACDLGTALARGNNTIQGNTTGLYVYVDGATLTASWVIQAVGNTWDPSVQGADASGHMAEGSIFSGPYTVSGSNSVRF